MQKAEEPADAERQGAEGLSAFVGRVLDQLSLSAWLPAAVLVGSLTVLLQLHSQPNRNLLEALNALTNQPPVGFIVAIIGSLVILTMVTQAFEFEVIRYLEGYWGRLTPEFVVNYCMGRQRRRFDSTIEERDTLTIQAFREARLLERSIVPARKAYVVSMIEGDLAGWLEVARWDWLTRYRQRKALSFEWRQFAPAETLHRLDVVEAALDEFPSSERLLPTHLGNILRAAEDSIGVKDPGELESFVIRRWHLLPTAIKKEHDQYRTRLDMYCTLVFVFSLLAVLAPLFILEGNDYVVEACLTLVGFLILARVSYTAAVTSARGYCTALRAAAHQDLAPS